MCAAVYRPNNARTAIANDLVYDDALAVTARTVTRRVAELVRVGQCTDPAPWLGTLDIVFNGEPECGYHVSPEAPPATAAATTATTATAATTIIGMEPAVRVLTAVNLMGVCAYMSPYLGKQTRSNSTCGVHKTSRDKAVHELYVRVAGLCKMRGVTTLKLANVALEALLLRLDASVQGCGMLDPWFTGFSSEDHMDVYGTLFPCVPLWMVAGPRACTLDALADALHCMKPRAPLPTCVAELRWGDDTDGIDMEADVFWAMRDVVDPAASMRDYVCECAHSSGLSVAGWLTLLLGPSAAGVSDADACHDADRWRVSTSGLWPDHLPVHELGRPRSQWTLGPVPLWRRMVRQWVASTQVLGGRQ